MLAAMLGDEHRMQTIRGEEALVCTAKVAHDLEIRSRDCGNDLPRHAGLSRALDDGIAIRFEFAVVEMAVRVDQRRHAAIVADSSRGGSKKPEPRRTRRKRSEKAFLRVLR